MEKDFKLMAAPLQGLTEAPWRSGHFRLFGERQGDVEYFTPFIRVEKGEVRKRDLRDFTSELNEGLNLTPQIIFRDVEEWRLLVDTLVDAGAKRIDMNMGCPFPPQVRKGRGAGLLSHPKILAEISEAMRQYADSVEFSVKMRLGVNDANEALGLVEILNSMQLRHVTVHPRTASQQYKGELHPDALSDFAAGLRHPVIFNGEVSDPSEIEALVEKFDGVMAGRGLLRRPTLFAEYRAGLELTVEERERCWLELIKGTTAVLEKMLCGAAQLRDKTRPYWEYAPATMDRKIVKYGKKNGMGST
ncbi:MAG: tRNA-dihydrouridine synthase family protein [Muribaculaceae bacterium]|nr:tRNA-dihydrouridine synthase family protein [Muribaculaceae bacterium]